MRTSVTVFVSSLALVMAVPTSARVAPAHTKRQAELNVLRFVVSHWASAPSALVNRRTHLLMNNTEAVCTGRGRPERGMLYTRFLCVVRPHAHHHREGLYFSYRALRRGRFSVRRLAYRRS
jgi:hypothetical protein